MKEGAELPSQAEGKAGASPKGASTSHTSETANGKGVRRWDQGDKVESGKMDF